VSGPRWTVRRRESERSIKVGRLGEDDCASLGHAAGLYSKGRASSTHVVVEAFWGRMQTELLNRQRWNTRVELAGAIFEYIEGFHNRARRHSALGFLTPTEYENNYLLLAANSSPASP